MGQIDDAALGKRGRKRKRPDFLSGGSWLGFVDVSLTADDRERVEGDTEQWQPKDTHEVIAAWLGRGYKFSLTYDELHSTWIATLTGVRPGCVNEGYSLSGRGPSLVGSLACLWHKEAVICQHDHWALVVDDPARQLSLFG